MFTNVLSHWKTSVAGVLIAIGTIAGVLSQQGITLGQAGKGTVVALIGALAAALLGLVSRDPALPPGPDGTTNDTQRMGAWMLIMLLLSGALFVAPATGCTSGQVVNEVNVIVTQATNILAVAEHDAPWLPTLKDAVAALKQAEANWQGGGSVNIVLSALNTVSAVLAVIPVTAPYAGLVSILVAGIESVVVAVMPQTKGAVRALAPNPYHGLATVKSIEDSKAQWNAVVDANPHLAVARL